MSAKSPTNSLFNCQTNNRKGRKKVVNAQYTRKKKMKLRNKKPLLRRFNLGNKERKRVKCIIGLQLLSK